MTESDLPEGRERGAPDAMTLELIPMLGPLARSELIEKIASAYQRKDAGLWSPRSG
jgi:hypothetical protein